MRIHANSFKWRGLLFASKGLPAERLILSSDVTSEHPTIFSSTKPEKKIQVKGSCVIVLSYLETKLCQEIRISHGIPHYLGRQFPGWPRLLRHLLLLQRNNPKMDRTSTTMDTASVSPARPLEILIQTTLFRNHHHQQLQRQ